MNASLPLRPVPGEPVVQMSGSGGALGDPDLALRRGYLSEEDVLLLQAALCDGERAVAAFRRWREVWDFEGHPEEGQFRLLPLVHANMARLGVEDPVMPRLRGIHRYSWCEAQRRRHVALGALRALRDAGIGCMALKGLALGLAYYDDPALRPMADLDLLVRPEEVAAAQRALLAAGWSCKAPDLTRSRAVRGHYLVRYIEMAFRKGRDEVDLHWHPLKEGPTRRLDEAFWSGAGTIRMEEVPLACPSPTMLLFHVVVHGMRPKTVSPLRWIADATMILRRHGDRIDWDRLHALAGELAVSGRLEAGLALLREVVGIEIPPAPAGARVTALERLERRAYLLEHRDPDSAQARRLLFVALVWRVATRGEKRLWAPVLAATWFAQRAAARLGRGRMAGAPAR